MDDIDVLTDEQPQENESKGGESTGGLKAGIVISVLLALVGVAIGIVAIIQIKNAETGIKSNTDTITTTNADLKKVEAKVDKFEPVAELYDASTGTLTVKYVDTEMINFTHGGKDVIGAMSIAGRPDILNIVSNVKDKGRRAIASFKYQDKVNPGSLRLAGGVSENAPDLKEHSCDPFGFC